MVAAAETAAWHGQPNARFRSAEVEGGRICDGWQH